MSRRNMIWLAAIVLVGLVVGAAVGVGWGFAAAGVVLVVSEVVERVRRARRRAERGDAPSVRGVIESRRKPR